MRQYSKTSSLIRNMVIVGDFLVLNILYYIYIHVGYVEKTFAVGVSSVKLMVAANMAMIVAQYFFSTVVHDRHTTVQDILKQVASLVILHGVANWLVNELVQGYEHLPVPDIRLAVCFVPMLFMGIMFVRFFERLMVKSYRGLGHNKRHAVFVGASPSLLSIYDYLMGDPSFGYNINGYYADAQMEKCPEELKYKGTLADLEKVMEGHLAPGIAEEVYCCLPYENKDLVTKLLHFCNGNTIHFYYVPVYPIVAEHSLKQENVGNTMAFTLLDEPLQKLSNRIIKRTFDIVVSLMVLICLLPFFPFIALAIKCSSKGPIFFRQARTGINGRDFYCYKFRSMHVNKDADKIQATKDDPRKFAFGNFMRKTNIDELPQFLNVLLGDMSIVGPRPHMLRHTEMYRDQISKYMIRHFVKPGITGWAQVTGYRGETAELWQMEGRVERDIWYIEHWSFWLDIVIMWKTARQFIVPDKHAY